MKKQINFFHSVAGVAVGTLLFLLVPFIAMQFTDDVKWGVTDFIIVGLLLYGTGVSYVLITKHTQGFIYRVAVGLAIGSTLLMIWANLAVGLIGSGPNAANLMYIGVIAVVIIGTILSRFTPRGMEYAMFITCLTIVFIAVIALIAKMDEFPGSSPVEIICVNAFFSTLYAISGLLFRHIDLKVSPAKPRMNSLT